MHVFSRYQRGQTDKMLYLKEKITSPELQGFLALGHLVFH